MKLKFPLAAAFAAVLSLAACGGGGGGDSTPAVVVANPPAFATTDIVVGTGAVAAVGKSATVIYTGWLYSATAADHKGNKFDSGTYTLPSVGGPGTIKGFDQGVQGMKVGGKRTVLVPSSLGYGASGSGTIPPNAGLVFDIELTAVK